MKSRPAPKYTPKQKRSQRRLLHDRQVKRWAQRITGDPEAKPHDLSECQLAVIATELAKRRGQPVNDHHFERAMEQTTPLLAVPQTTDPVGDLDWLLNGLPEMQDFWHAWQRPADLTGSRGPVAADEAVKALMATMAIPGICTHATDAHWLLRNVPAFGAVFERVAAEGARRVGKPAPSGPFNSRSYGGAMRHRPEVATDCSLLAMKTNIALLKQLRELVAPAVGKRLLIDGSLIPAWAPQRSSNGNPDVEAALREHAPDAGFRAVQYTGNGKADVNDLSSEQVKKGVKGGVSKAVRGYYLVVIVDQATGLPMVWSLHDSKAARDDGAGAAALAAARPMERLRDRPGEAPER